MTVSTWEEIPDRTQLKHELEAWAEGRAWKERAEHQAGELARAIRKIWWLRFQRTILLVALAGHSVILQTADLGAWWGLTAFSAVGVVVAFAIAWWVRLPREPE